MNKIVTKIWKTLTNQGPRWKLLLVAIIGILIGIILHWCLSPPQMAHEEHAETVKSILADWIAKNPYACSINWACTMEVAIRSITWIWLFHVFCKSKSWQQDTKFQEQFLTSLYLINRI